MNPMLKHQIRIAKATLKMSSVGANIMGGPNKSEAIAILEKCGKLPVACYDNGGETIDRYTVVYTSENIGGVYACIGMSGNPMAPNGFGQHSECVLGKHLGKRILFKDLPPDCQTVVRRDLEA